MKQGYPLRAIDGFDPQTLNTLRDQLSVTTAEEFLHFATVYPEIVAQLLSTDLRSVGQFAGAAASALSEEDVTAILHPSEPAYTYRTGHDAPPAGKTFWGNR